MRINEVYIRFIGLTSYPHIVWCVSWNLPKFLLFLVFLHVCMLVIARPQYSFVYVLACYLAMVAFAFCSLVASLANHQRTFCTSSKIKLGELATPFDTLCHPFSFSQSVPCHQDIDLASCLKLHGSIIPQRLGEVQELPSRNFAEVLSGAGRDLLLGRWGEPVVKVDRSSEVSLSYKPDSA